MDGWMHVWGFFLVEFCIVGGRILRQVEMDYREAEGGGAGRAGEPTRYAALKRSGVLAFAETSSPSRYFARNVWATVFHQFRTIYTTRTGNLGAPHVTTSASNGRTAGVRRRLTLRSASVTL